MAFAASLAELQAEASCPLCLDYLRDPVTLDCGHNFCGSCIQQCWVDLQDVFPCPVCLHHCPQRSFKRNNQLRNIIDMVKQLCPGSSKRKRQEEEPTCEQHNEVLDLFCEDDLQLLCPQCRGSGCHQGHHLIPTGRAAESQRKKFKTLTELLKTKINDAQKGCRDQLTQYMDGRWQMDIWKGELHTEFEHFKLFLRKEQFSIQARLLNKEKDLRDKLARNKSQIVSDMDTVKTLLRDMTEKSLLADQDFLESVENLQQRYEKVPSPAVSSYEFEKENLTLPPHYFGLHKMMSKFQEDLTLDPETAHSHLTVSNDRKSVVIGTGQPHLLVTSLADGTTPFPAVLCCEAFDGGRHFWQVEVKGTGVFSLGVCKESFRRNLPAPPFTESDFWHFDLSLNPNGISCIQQPEPVERIGVFLDCDLGELSFYNMKNRSHLHKLTGTLPKGVVPYFAIGPLSSSLTIRMIID